MKTAEEAGSLNARPEQMRRAWRRARAIARHKRPGLILAGPSMSPTLHSVYVLLKTSCNIFYCSIV